MAIAAHVIAQTTKRPQLLFNDSNNTLFYQRVTTETIIVDLPAP